MNHKVAFSFADGKTLFFPVGANEILLDAALRNGIKIPLDCREGVCGTCQGRCESGDYSQDYVDEEALSSLDLQQRKMLSCQTRVKSDATFYFDFDSSLCNAPGPVQVRGTVSCLTPTTARAATCTCAAASVLVVTMWRLPCPCWPSNTRTWKSAWTCSTAWWISSALLVVTVRVNPHCSAC